VRDEAKVLMPHQLRREMEDVLIYDGDNCLRTPMRRRMSANRLRIASALTNRRLHTVRRTDWLIL
jgi:hypothetical protein